MAEDEVQLNSGRFGYGSRHADATSPSALRVISWRCVRSLVGWDATTPMPARAERMAERSAHALTGDQL